MSKAINDVSAVLERLLPVGSIVEWAPVDGSAIDLSTPEKVAAYYGFGTWEAYGGGRMLLGVSGSHAVGSTGGEETHTLTQNELPEYTIGRVYTADTNVEKTGGWVKTDAGDKTAFGPLKIGNGHPHENMPPYITIYRWRRIA